MVIPWTNYLPCWWARRCQTHTLAPTINIHTFFNNALKLMLTGLAEGPLSPTCLCELARFSVPRRSRLQRRGIDTHARAWAHTHTRTGILCLPGFFVKFVAGILRTYTEFKHYLFFLWRTLGALGGPFGTQPRRRPSACPSASAASATAQT